MMQLPATKIIECPRDAMQGLHEFIPTEIKIKYLNSLLKVGFDTLDFGSFVSPAAVPQMADTAEVLAGLDWENSNTRLLAIIANKRGAEEASKFNAITYLGFPLSVSETFQKRNTNKSIEEALNLVEEVQNICIKEGKTFVVYLSMAFGNPYGDPFSVDYISEFTEKLALIKIPVISLADTVGVSDIDTISFLFNTLIPSYPEIEFGAHLHSHPANALKKIESAFNAGCRRFDTAIKGFGGCPMAKDELVGNIATETLIHFLNKNTPGSGLDENQLALSIQMASEVFPLQ